MRLRFAKTRHWVAVVAGLVTLASAGEGAAQAPAMLPVQGVVTDIGGTPLSVNANVTFRLYDDPTIGAPLFVETHSIAFTDGNFTAYLGSVDPANNGLDLALFRDNTNAYLGIEVESDGEMSPRLQLGSTPFAAYAEFARDATTLQGSGPASFAGASHAHDFSDLMSRPVGLDDGDDDTLAGLSCSDGDVAKWSGGVWTCQPDSVGSGTVTSITAGDGLQGGTVTAAGVFSVDSTVQRRSVVPSCPSGQALRALSATGAPTCEPIPPPITCNWTGARFVSHGWDGACAFTTGANITCTAGYVTAISFTVGSCGVN